MITYTTDGSVRGACGHAHRTIEAAVRCVERDGRRCANQGGYTDRVVRRADGGALSDAERETTYG